MSNEMKRLTAPRSWPVQEEDQRLDHQAFPGCPRHRGEHPGERGHLRDLLHLCNTASEVSSVMT